MSFQPDEVIFDRSCENSDHSDVWDDSALISAYDKAVSNAYTKIANRRRRGTSNETLNSDVSTTVSESNANLNTVVKGQKKNNMKDGAVVVPPMKWKVGDACRAKYELDGLTYEAKVTYVNHKNGSCRVTFVGYGNTEPAFLSSLEPSRGEQTVKAQIRAATVAAVSGSQLYNSGHVEERNEAEIESDTSQASGTHQRHQQYEPDTRRFKHSSDDFVPVNRPSRTSGWSVPPRSSPQNECFPPMPFPTPPPFPIDEPAEEDEALANMLMSWYMNGYHSGYYQGLKLGRMRQSSSPSTNRARHSSRI